MQYGLPYKGSKSKIADQIIEQMPPGSVLYDLFAGGCAITHAALLSGKWRKVVANDIKPYPSLFRDAALGKYRKDYRWVSRDDFFATEDPFVKIIFSFGNDCRTYIYAEGDKNENYKRALHYAICFHDYGPMKEGWGVDLSPIDSCKTMKQRRLAAYRLIDNGGTSVKLENLERLERLQNLERLERLQNLERLEVIQGNYFDVEIDEDAVIYCDIPYSNTNGYGAKKMSDFDYKSFYDWALAQKAPVFISEYDMPRDKFTCIWETKVNSLMANDRVVKATERLFIPKGQKRIKTTLF